MNHRTATSLFLVAALVGVACVDMSAPKGAASISTLRLPSPSVVVGDVMRDSNGVPTPLSIVAYDANSAPVTGLSVQFFVADTLHVAHLDANNQLVGDKIGSTRLLGQVGSLQTSAVIVPVTYAPSHILIPTKTDSIDAPIGADSATSMITLPLPVAVRSAQDSASQGFIVRYVITHAPATAASATSPAVYLSDDLGKLASADTTDLTGVASPKLVVNSFFLADLVKLGAKTTTDSVVVEASANYKGTALSGSPLRFVIKVTASFPTFR